MDVISDLCTELVEQPGFQTNTYAVRIAQFPDRVIGNRP